MGESADERKPERIQKVLARLGYGSRRSCEQIILQGRVKINGRLATLGDKVLAGHDELRVDGHLVLGSSELTYYLVHKPKGVICSSSDPYNRKSILELVPSTPRVFSVGRLDFDSEGLIILTNDGDLSYALTHPSLAVEKEYLVQLRRRPTDSELNRLRHGILLEDGRTHPATFTRLDDTLVRVVLHEGRNRQIRRMFEATSNEVTRLVRVRIGDLVDQRLAPGAYRVLTSSEVISLRKSVGNSRLGKRSERP
ncbi:23S rRNA pseudouridine2605 synthase [Ferrithrix thermotolerans DSM 19514]|uniref:Pseudouridine synthase n=1 Tax=Ferrithrix thermotolerans DSM 19514 TaxID=1121881 RepID=A0A1M4W3F7_9ACTN|nr:pseudouridine synthase [Ferrithrix thermotolerans]SHE75643.1 23S rRNA pseudouridine2605 synthase [Ferrithrix thermotolerans DSM 19514]